MKEIIEKITEWIKGTLTDEKNSPSANRQAGFVVLVALIIFSVIGLDQHIIETFAGLVGALFLGTQIPKLAKSARSGKSAIPLEDKKSEQL